MRILLVGTVITVSSLVPLHAADTRPPQQFTVRPAAGEIVIDGKLDEAAWDGATAIPVRYEWFPGDNTPAPVATDAYVTFSRTHLYLGFRARDPRPHEIRANYADRDTPFSEDTVGFMIDPFNDQRRAFQFRINALGVQMDATNSDVDGSEDWSWDAIWASAGRITAEGYEVEVALPFASLRFPSKAEAQTWGIVVMRDYPRSTRIRMRSSWTDRDRTCQICQFDKITGFAQLQQGRGLELDPTVTASQSDSRENFPHGSMESGDTRTDFGLTAKWAITPNWIVNAALNPDFSHVEADAAQLDINTRFALFYPEKRPFFLEGADFFSTPILTVFTRTVADPEFGLKLTGKEGKHAVGVFVARDEINNLVIPGDQGSNSVSLEQEVDDAVLRYRRDLGETSTLGVQLTSRNADDYSNHLLSVDGSFTFNDTETISFQVAETLTEYPDAIADAFGQERGSFDGNGYAFSYGHGDRNWSWYGEYRELTPGFRADFGFEARVGFRAMAAGLHRTFWGSTDQWFNRIIVGVGSDRTTYHGDPGNESGQDIFVNYFGPLQSSVGLSYAQNREYYDGRTYENPRWNSGFSIRPNRVWGASLSVRGGKTIDFANSRQAEFFSVGPAVDFNLGRHLSGRVSHNYQDFEVAEGDLFSANLTQARLVYNFNLRTFVRAIVQYTDIERNPLVWPGVGKESQRYFSQLLFSYKVNPQTVFLAGYSDSALGSEEFDLTPNARTLFVKVGYAWLF